jgi:hypothetical protein
MSYIIKVHGRNEATEKIMTQILQLAEQHDFIDAFREDSESVGNTSEIDERLDYLAEHNIEHLKKLAKCELIRRKIHYKRITKFPPPSAYKDLASRASLFYVDYKDSY